MQFLWESTFFVALLAVIVAGFGATTLGSFPVLFLRRLSEKVNNQLLSFAAGVMLAATIFSLLIPAVSAAKAQGASQTFAVLQTIIALCAGGATLWAVNRYVPHEHFFGKGHEGVVESHLKKIWLFVIAIAIHNFPEGLSVGVASSSRDFASGLGATLGIGLQNIPEGLSVSLALHSQGYSRKYSFFVGALTGAIEIIGGVIGAGVLAISMKLLPIALAFAAGSMLFIVSDEIIPETHRPGFEGGATAALFGGFVVMMFLDSVFSQ